MMKELKTKRAEQNKAQKKNRQEKQDSKTRKNKQQQKKSKTGNIPPDNGSPPPVVETSSPTISHVNGLEPALAHVMLMATYIRSSNPLAVENFFEGNFSDAPGHNGWLHRLKKK